MEYVVRRTRIIGTDTVVYSAWKNQHRPANAGLDFPCGATIKRIEGEWFDRVGTDPDRTLYAHLAPGSEERFIVCEAEYQSRYDLAYALIHTAFPELVHGNGHYSMGEITTIDSTGRDNLTVDAFHLLEPRQLSPAE